MNKQEEVRMQFRLSQEKMYNRIKEALQDFNDETGIYVKGHFGFYGLLTPGHERNSDMRTIEISCKSELTINPEVYNLIDKVLK